MMAARQYASEPLLSELLAGLVEVDAARERTVRGITLDSRQAAAGGLFLARAGEASHGLDHLDQALANGAVAVVCEAGGAWTPERIDALAANSAVPVWRIDELAGQAGVIASRFYGRPSHDMRVVGITGTNGKTSCSHFLAQALAPDEVCGILGTLGYGLPGALQPASHTTPDPAALQGLLADLHRRGAASVAMEVSSHALAQGRAAGVLFDTAVFTNLSRDHLDFHGDMAEYGAVKARLFQTAGLGRAVINADDALGRSILHGLPREVQGIAYGQSLSVDEIRTIAPRWLVGERVSARDGGLRAELRSSWGEGELTTPLLGRFNISNLLAVLGVLLARGLELNVALDRLATLSPLPGRMEAFGGGSQPLAVVDYAHTPDALEQALIALREHAHGELVCVFGCGGERDPGKRPLMGEIAERLAERVIVTDDNPRCEDGDAIVDDIVSGMRHPQAVQVERDRARAIHAAIKGAKAGDVVLVAGKGHEDYQQAGDLRLPFSDREQVRRCLEAAG